MKNTRKLLSLVLAAALCFALIACLALFAACDNTVYGTLTLEQGNGGTLETTEYQVAVGTSVKDFLTGKDPTPQQGLTFAGWYDGDAAFTDAEMTEEGLTLTAKYNAQYTLTIYKEGEIEGDYDVSPEIVTGTAIYGESFSVFTNYSVPHGFLTDTEHSNYVAATDSLGKDAQFTIYLERATYVFLYEPNLSAEHEWVGNRHVYLRFGVQTTIEDGFIGIERELRFAGWAEQPDGDVVYSAGQTIDVNDHMTFYAVWQQGIADYAGGEDILFVDGNVAYLRRFGLEDKTGTYNPDTRIFTFTVSEGNDVTGRVAADGKSFSWYDADSKVTYKQYDFRSETVLNTTLALDGYNGAIYTPDGGAAQNGFYKRSGDCLEFVPESGKGFIFKLGNEQDQDVFAVRDDVYGYYVAADGFSGSLELDGFGMATYTDYYETTSQVPYEYDGKLVTYTIESDYSWEDPETYEVYLTTAVIDGEETKVFVTRGDESGTYTGAGSVEVDGFGGLTYTPAQGDAVDGEYQILSWYFDDYYTEYYVIIFKPFVGEQMAFSLNVDDSEFTLLEGPVGEFQLAFSAGDYYSLLQILGGGQAQILFLMTSGYYDVGAVGTVTENDGVYTFTATSFEIEDDDVKAQYASFKFVIDGDTYRQYLESADVNLWAGRAHLVLDGYGRGTYTDENNHSYTGIFDVVQTITRFVDTTTGDYFAFVIDSEGNTFRKVGTEAGSYILFSEGQPDANSILFLDGEGKATISGNPEQQGTYAAVSGAAGEYTFTAGDVSFRFTLSSLSQGSGSVLIWAKSDEKRIHTYEVSGGGQIVADEYGFAVWTDGKGVVREGLILVDGNYVFFAEVFEGVMEEDQNMFAILENGKLALIGGEAGSYHLLDRDVIRDEYIELDGYGHAAIYDAEGNKTIEGTYAEGTNNQYYFDYFDENGDYHGFKFMTSVVNTNDGDTEMVYVVYKEAYELADSTGEWKALSLDGYNTAYVTDELGFVTSYVYEVMDETVIRLANVAAGAYDYYRIDTKKNVYSAIDDDMILSADGKTLIIYRGSETSVVVPDTVIVIGPDAFYGTRVETINLANVEIISESAFESARLSNIIGGDKVKEIGTYAFFENIFLPSVSFPNVEKIGEAAFRFCESARSITFGEKLTEIGARALQNLGRNAVVTINAATAPAIAADTFDSNVKIQLASAAAAVAYYKAEIWSSLASQIALAEDAAASFYTAKLDGEFVFDGQAKLNGAVLGVYEKTTSGYKLYMVSGTDTAEITLADGKFTYQEIEYLAAGTVVNYTKDAETLSFGVGSGKITATFNGNEVTLNVAIGGNVTFEYEKYTYTVTLSDGLLFDYVKVFTPYSVAYTGKENTRSSITVKFNDEEGSDVEITSASMYFAGRNFRSTGATSTYGKPTKSADHVYTFTLETTATVNGARSKKIVFNVTMTLDDAEKEVSYVFDLVFDGFTIAIGDNNVNAKVVLSFDKTTTDVTAVELYLGSDAAALTKVDLTFTVAYGSETTHNNPTVTATVTTADYAGTYTMALTSQTTAFSVTKAAAAA